MVANSPGARGPPDLASSQNTNHCDSGPMKVPSMTNARPIRSPLNAAHITTTGQS